jgi:solute carrier family 10 (sodium/bile acid cotransporter), member 7
MGATPNRFAMLRKHWFLIGLIGVVTLGASANEFLTPLASMKSLQTAMVFTVMWLMAAPVPFEIVKRTLTRPGPGLLAASINMGLVPLLAMCAAPLLQQDLSGGLLVASTVPSTLASAAVWTRKAGGDDTVAIFVTLLTNLSCVVVTPLWLVLLLGVRVQLNWLELVQSLALIVVLPIALAQFMRWNATFALTAERNKTRLGVICQLGILLMVLLGSVQMGQRLASSEAGAGIDFWQLGGLILLASSVHVTALLVAWYVAVAFQIERPQRIAVALSGSQKTLMVGLKLAIDCGVSILPMVVFHIAQLLIDAIFVQRWSRLTRTKTGELL